MGLSLKHLVYRFITSASLVEFNSWAPIPQTLVDNLSKEVGSPVKVTDFLRVEVGEGIER